jgi:AraC-like DNA-binding protein
MVLIMRTIKLLTEEDSPLSKEGFLVRRFPSYSSHTPYPHTLDVILFSWFVSGEGTHYIDKNRFSVKPGSMGITPAGISHDIITGEKMEIINLCINPHIFPLPLLPEPFMKYLPVLLPLHPSFSAFRENGLQIECKNPEILTGLLMRVLAEQEEERFGSVPLCRELLKLFFMELIRNVAEEGHRFISKVNRPQSRRVMEIVSYLDARFAQEHSLEALSRQFGFSKSAICGNFKKATGHTLFDYIHMKRVEHCILLLRSTNLNISEIVYDCGFRIFLTLTKNSGR